MDQTCTRCGGTYNAEAFFGRRAVRNAYLTRRPVCIGCEQSARDKRKQGNRWRSKARDTLRRHAKRYGIEPDEFSRRYGWDLGRMAHDAEHAYENGCPHCASRFLLMGHGLADITLDIVRPDEPPYYANTRWICATCNRQKGRTPAHLWGAKVAAWIAWRRQAADPGIGRLFDPTQYEEGK